MMLITTPIRFGSCAVLALLATCLILGAAHAQNPVAPVLKTIDEDLCARWVNATTDVAGNPISGHTTRVAWGGCDVSTMASSSFDWKGETAPQAPGVTNVCLPAAAMGDGDHCIGAYHELTGRPGSAMSNLALVHVGAGVEPPVEFPTTKGGEVWELALVDDGLRWIFYGRVDAGVECLEYTATARFSDVDLWRLRVVPKASTVAEVDANPPLVFTECNQ